MLRDRSTVRLRLIARLQAATAPGVREVHIAEAAARFFAGMQPPLPGVPLTRSVVPQRAPSLESFFGEDESGSFERAEALSGDIDTLAGCDSNLPSMALDDCLVSGRRHKPGPMGFRPVPDGEPTYPQARNASAAATCFASRA